MSRLGLRFLSSISACAFSGSGQPRASISVSGISTTRMPGPLGMGACSMVLGVALGAVQPMVMSLLHDVAPIDRQGEAMALRSLTMNASSFTMPMLFGSIGAVIGTGGLFWLVAVVLAVGARSVPALGTVAALPPAQ